VNELLKA